MRTPDRDDNDDRAPEQLEDDQEPGEEALAEILREKEEKRELRQKHVSEHAGKTEL